MKTPLKAVVRSVDGGTVTLALEDGQTLRIPESSLEGRPEAGAEVRLIAVVPAHEERGRHALARNILNELLDTSPPNA